MKQFFFLLVLSTTFSFANIQKDSISYQELKVIQLENEVQNLQKNIDKNEKHIKELLAENEKLSDSNFEKVDSRLTNFIWLISVVGGLVVASLTFFGWKYLSSSINNFFKERAKKLADQKLNSLITEEWLRVQVEKKSKAPINAALEILKEDFNKISDKIIKEGADKIEKQHNIAKQTIEKIELLRDSLEEQGFATKTGRLNKEDKEKLKKAAETPKSEENFNWEDWFWKGRNQYEEGDYIKALEYFNKSDKLNPNIPSILNWIASTKIYNNEIEEGIKITEKVLKIDAESITAYNLRGYAKNKLKKYQEAIIDLNKAIQIDPSFTSALINRGYAKNQIKQYNLAIKDFKIALKNNSSDPFPHAHIAYSYIMTNQLNKAVRSNNMAIKLNPEYERPFYNLGLIKQKQGHQNEACIAWKKALDLGFEEAKEKLDEFCKKESK